jgi:hypothetical protein
MPALASDLRKSLETTVLKARELAERGARDALTALAVNASEPFLSMTDVERKLRNRLRAHARQLGDQRDSQKGTQGIERLVREMAYEHWHRMLFARFLAENQLLIEPSSGVSISLDECEDLAAEEGTDLWGLAAQFAQEMLPQIFRVDDPVLAAALPIEIRQKLQALLESLAVEVFIAEDSLGWTYQFWRATEKQEINENSRKIGADELPAVTQLFTEDYMVSFLLDNTLGAWHASKLLLGNLSETGAIDSEQDARQAVALPQEKWDYLRLKTLADGSWMPACGVFGNWPQNAKDLKCIDPCMGSGHFIVAMLRKLTSLRQAEEGLGPEDAVASVIAQNLYGLEIDARCTQIAAFNIAIAAWGLAGRYFKLPRLNIACSGITPSCSRAEWMDIANQCEGLWESLSDGDAQRVTRSIGRLYDTFTSADLLGSLIDVKTQGDLLTADYSLLAPFLAALAKSDSLNDEVGERAGAALGMSSVITVLNTDYHLVATNFPFLTQNKLPDVVNQHIREKCVFARAELATAFAALWLQRGQSLAFVSPSEWLYLGRFKDFRKHLLSSRTPRMLATLGLGSFETPLRVNPELSIIDSATSSASSIITSIDVSCFAKIAEKKAALILSDLASVKKEEFLRDHDYRLLSRSTDSSEGHLLSVDADARAGMFAGDGEQFIFFFWEIKEFGQIWEPLQSTVSETIDYGGRSFVVRWEKEQGEIASLAESVKHLNHAAQNWRRGKPLWGKAGVAVSLMGELPCTLYTGEIYDMNCCAVVPKDPSGLQQLWNFCKSGRFSELVREIDKSLKLTPKTLLKIHWDPGEWSFNSSDDDDPIAEIYSPDPTQWIFHGHPGACEEDLILQVALARIAGYQWPAERDSKILLGVTGRLLAKRCSEIDSHADPDGIICLHPLRGKTGAAELIRALLAEALEGGFNFAQEKRLVASACKKWNSKTCESIDDWLRNSFFTEHVKAFRSRPFLWHIWDGSSGGFEAIVNAHMLCGSNGQGRRTIEALAYTYLGDWIEMQKLASAEGVPGSEARLLSALDLRRRLEDIIVGEPPFDLFCRWKPIYEMPIGWEPDLNDGIKVNIRPFVQASLSRGGKAGAGLLKSKPGSLKWTTDKGRDPIENRTQDGFPWLWTYADSATSGIDIGVNEDGSLMNPVEYDGVRRNELHYTRAAKEAARARHRGEG